VFHTHKYRDRDAIDEEYQRIGGMFENASFPPDVVDSFRALIRQLDECPIIVRSSSYLEDSFGLAFSGKYQSIFLANQGDEETRLEAFIRGVKTVLASMYGPDPIIYRRDHGLLDFNERMAMIVQKVVGRRFGDWYFPFAAGVLYSSNSWAWNPRIRKEDGLVRLVFGLGTRAVDRVGGDYPRMVPLSHPQLRPEVTADQIRKYSQRQVDVLNLRTGQLETVDFRTLCENTTHPELFYAVAVQQHDHLAAPLFKTQDLNGQELCLTFENLLTKTAFPSVARKMASQVEAAYGRPVDIEFAWDGSHLYLLQCRSLSVRREAERVDVPGDVPLAQTLFTTPSAFTTAVVPDLEYIVYVDPKAYDRLPTYESKIQVAQVVNVLNKLLAARRYALMGPGRWGSNDINLGVRVTYSNINRTKLLVEIAFARENYTPEVSYGTHFFQDLVEADIVVTPLFPDETGGYFDEAFLLKSENLLVQMAPEYAACAEVVHVIHVPGVRDQEYLHVYLDAAGHRGLAFFAQSQQAPSGKTAPAAEAAPTIENPG